MKLRVLYLQAGTTRLLWTVMLAGAATFAIALGKTPTVAWTSFLTAAFYFLTVALGAVVFMALGYVGGAGWNVVLKRVAEALGGWIPVGAITMVALLAGVPKLYHWAHHEAVAGDAILEAKSAYLNLPFFALRMAVVLSLWIGFALWLRSNSRKQDRDGKLVHTKRNVAVSAAFLGVFFLSFSMASFDWMMSLEPHWISTIFGFYNITGLLVSGVAGLTVATILLRRRGLLPSVTDSHLHDLGKYLFAFSTLWGYHWFSQYMLIWYSNIPEETAYYVLRTQGGWSFLFYFNIIAGWAIPFMVLLPRPAKRSEGHLFRVALWMLGARWLDVYLMATPGNAHHHFGVGIVDVLVFAGFAAAFVLVFARNLGAAPVVAKNDPYLVEALHHRT